MVVRCLAIAGLVVAAMGCSGSRDEADPVEILERTRFETIVLGAGGPRARALVAIHAGRPVALRSVHRTIEGDSVPLYLLVTRADTLVIVDTRADRYAGRPGLHLTRISRVAGFAFGFEDYSDPERPGRRRVDLADTLREGRYSIVLLPGAAGTDTIAF